MIGKTKVTRPKSPPWKNLDFTDPDICTKVSAKKQIERFSTVTRWHALYTQAELRIRIRAVYPVPDPVVLFVLEQLMQLYPCHLVKFHGTCIRWDIRTHWEKHVFLKINQVCNFSRSKQKPYTDQITKTRACCSELPSYISTMENFK